MQHEDSFWDRYWAVRKSARRAARPAARQRRVRGARLDGRDDGLNYWQRRQRRRS
jgi:hypothetical protein